MWFIAHPTKMMRDTSGKVPCQRVTTLVVVPRSFARLRYYCVYRPDLSNSTLQRYIVGNADTRAGKQGDTVLNYDPITSSYAQELKVYTMSS